MMFAVSAKRLGADVTILEKSPGKEMLQKWSVQFH